MKTKLLFFFAVILPSTLFSQVPQGFNYQALARDASGNPLLNKDIQVRISILSDTTGFYSSGSGTYLWEEQHAVSTNDNGLFNLVIGTKARLQGSATSFSHIDWSKGPLYVGIKIQYLTAIWRNMGTARLNSVPYSMLADKANGVIAGSKLSVTSSNDLGTEALFEVKRKDGQTVFAVYPDAVNIYVPRSAGKGSKGGFAIGGFDGSKGNLNPQDYFRVTPDSVRIYIDPTPVKDKGSKGGFAIGGYDGSKGINNMYFNLSGASAVNTVVESPQILWYPTKKAFLAGTIHIGAVDSVGQNSTALGYRSIAMGDYSQAFGYKAKAFGDYSTSIGKNSIAGSRTTPVANNAFAFGNGTKATGNDSYAFGSAAEASGTTSIALGMGSKATNSNALALGNGTIASGPNSTAMGYQSQSQGDKSIAIGSFYSYSYLIPIINTGKGSSGSSSKGISDVFLPVRPVIPISTFNKVFSRANIAQGQYSVAIGNGNLAQNGGLVFGSNCDATQFGALALGTSASANQANSAAIGYGSTANGIYSVALGNNITANSYGELAFGQWNEVQTGTAGSWDENDLLLSVGNGLNDGNRSNAMTIFKNGKTVLRGRYAVSTFNYKTLRLLYNPITHSFYQKDYVYGMYSNLSRDDAAIEYYYSGYFGSEGTSGIYYGLYADVRSGASIDVAEYIYDTMANTEAADVVVADPSNKESVIKSSKPFQTSVLGVVSTKPHMTMGMELITDEKTGKPLNNPKPVARLALTGRVPVKVNGENGSIAPGDLLTTSSTPGCAMKWDLIDTNTAKDFDDLKRIISENEKRGNAIIGKAVESFSGDGISKIMVLISLQ